MAIDTRLVDGDEDEQPEIERVNPMRFKAAEEALAWTFGSMASAIGFGAQNIASGGGGLVWDAARIASLHMKMRAPARMKAAEQIRRLEWATAALERPDFEIAHLAFTPRGLSPEMRCAFRKGDGKRCLAAVAAVKCALATRLRDRRRDEAQRRLDELVDRMVKLDKRPRPDTERSAAELDELRLELQKAQRQAERARNDSVFEFLEWECASLNKDKLAPPRILGIRDEADTLVTGVVERFIPILDERDAYDFQQRAAKKDQIEKRNAAFAATLQPQRPQTTEERMQAIDEIVERMVHGGGPRQ